MPGSVRRIAKRISQYFAWYTMHQRDREESARRKNFAAFQKRRQRLSRLADLRFQDFCISLNHYRSQLSHLKSLDAVHETYCWDRLRFNLGPSLIDYLDEPRPGLSELEAALRISYRQSAQCANELEQLLSELHQMCREIPQANLPDAAIQSVQESLEREYKERCRSYAPWKTVLVDNAGEGDVEGANGSTIGKWRVKQNRRRHTLE